MLKSIALLRKRLFGIIQPSIPFSSVITMYLFGTIAFGTRVHRKQLALIEEAAKLLRVTRNEIVRRGAVANPVEWTPSIHGDFQAIKRPRWSGA